MGRHKRFLSGLLSAAMLAGLVMTGVPALAAADTPAVTVETGFTDIAPGAWYAEAVAFCRENGLMNGMSDTEFDPQGTMTRAMLATVLYRMEGEPAAAGLNPFQDVVTDSWYGPAVIWAAEQELIQGYGNGICAPNDPVTREQMVTILWRYAGSPAPAGTAPVLADEADIPAWAAAAVDWSSENNIVINKGPNSFFPGDTALRYEIAAALMNYSLSQTEPAPEPEPTPGLTPEPTPITQPDDPEIPPPPESEPEPTPTPSTEPDPETDPWEEFQAVFGYRPEATDVAPNRYIPEGFVAVEEEDGFRYMTYEFGRYTLGVDVSSHQEEIDWQQAADAGIEFAMIRVGYRGYTMGTLNADSYFVRNIEGALDAGLQVGVYFFSQAVTVEEALEEAQYTLEKIRDYPIEFPVVFDWERQEVSTSRTKDTDEDTIAACAVAFCEAVKAAGYTPMFYSSPNKAYELELGYLSDYPFWLAHYTKDMAPSSYQYHFDIWQYTSSGTVPGISTNVDMNICLRQDW